MGTSPRMQDATMKRKDCDNPTKRPTKLVSRPRIPTVAATALCLSCAHAIASAESIRILPAAVVVDDVVKLGDACELRGFDADQYEQLSKLPIGDAPRAGSSLLLAADSIVEKLSHGGVNRALVTISGSTTCEISRPAAPTRSVAVPSTTSDSGISHRVSKEGPSAPGSKQVSTIKKSTNESDESPTAGTGSSATLRAALVRHFDAGLERYGGAADVTFDRSSESLLALSGPAYSFDIRRKNGPPLGLCPLEVDIVNEGRVVQTVPLAAQVALSRRVVIARRAINQGATIVSTDVERVTMSFHRLDDIGVDDLAQVIGQKSKRFLPAGSVLELNELEAVPLVLRGQLVSIRAEVGGVRVVTTGKATQDGLRGDIIKVRAVDDQRTEFDAEVIAPGEVCIAAPVATSHTARWVAGGKP